MVSKEGRLGAYPWRHPYSPRSEHLGTTPSPVSQLLIKKSVRNKNLVIDFRGVLRILGYRRKKYHEFSHSAYFGIQVLRVDLPGDSHPPDRFVLLTATKARA